MIERDIIEVLQDLPEICAAAHPSLGIPIMLKRGSVGYWPAPLRIDPDEYNENRGITKAQAEAMLNGSVFGFDVPAADPLNCEEQS